VFAVSFHRLSNYTARSCAVVAAGHKVCTNHSHNRSYAGTQFRRRMKIYFEGRCISFQSETSLGSKCFSTRIFPQILSKFLFINGLKISVFLKQLLVYMPLFCRNIKYFTLNSTYASLSTSLKITHNVDVFQSISPPPFIIE
jgi:hypothetical protein